MYAALTLTSEQRTRIDAIHTECVGQTGVDPEVIKKGRLGEFPDDLKFKEFLLCVTKKESFPK
ncbi:hypothetical protein NQ314_014909 [Rhamnusium bicolor]|uniref:Uncharacterized protein n=1 Tax=Rhamnusium bicolor TaxID=1586634 RepID=A0AAV8X0C3_9CUCU|nr:hypothetical protein NQ314_014909 [Rhamnusium bicolor]